VPTCRDVSELVTDYLERTLPLRRWVGVRWHLVQCDACRRYIAQMRRTVRLLATNTFPPPAPETEDGVVEAARGGHGAPAPGD
jgi:predicted anti-sigma-YlaC factor YlaD